MNIKHDVRIRKIEKIERNKEDIDSKFYRLMARDEEGIVTVLLTQAEQFNGLKAGQTIIVELYNPQTTLKNVKKKE